MATQLTLFLGPPGASSIPDMLAEYLADLQQNQSGTQLWAVADAPQAEALQTDIAKRLPGVLSPGIKPLAQAAEALVAAAPKPVRPVTAVQRARLLTEVLERGAYARRYRLLDRAAQSPGGLDYVASAISQLAQANRPMDELLDLAAETRDQRVIELARAYQDYDAALAKHNLMDRDARLRLACELCESGRTISPGFVALSGVESPTPLELRFLLSLLSRAKRASVALTVARPDDLVDSSQLPNPYATPAAFAVRLRNAFPEGDTRWAADAFDTSDPRAVALDHLFEDPRGRRRIAVAAKETRLSIHGADGVQQEIDDAAHHAKQLLLAGAKAEEVVVATRRLTELAPRIEEAFASVGVPLASEGAPRLGRAPMAVSVSQLLRLAAADWRHEDLLGAIVSPRFMVFDTPLEDNERTIARRLGFASRRAAVEWVVRDLLYPKGRKALIERVEWLAGQWAEREANAAEQFDRRGDRLSASAWLAAGPLRLLSQACETFHAPAAPLDWHDRLIAALQQLAYKTPSTGNRATELDAAAAPALEETFASLARLGDWRKLEAEQLALRDIEPLVAAWLSRVQLDLPWRREGCVRALTAETASGLRPKHLLLVGLDEQSFPRTENSPALPLTAEQQRRRQSEEMLLFCKLMGAATDSTTLSYAARDDRAQPLNPSSYVAELERLFTEDALRKATLNDQKSPLSAREQRRQAVRGLMEGEPQPFAQLLASPDNRSTATALARGLQITYERTHGDSFGPAEGILQGDAVLELMQTRYGPDHLWSASQLEQYGTCPFKFYLRHVLGAEPLESLALDVDYRRRGSLLHDAMVHFHQRVNQMAPEGQASTSVPAEEFLEAFAAAVREACDAISAAPHEQAVAEVEAMQAVAWGELYRGQHEKYDAQNMAFDQPLRPAHHEARFGPKVSQDDAPQDPLSTPEPYELSLGDHAILLTGQVDRIDVGRVGGQTVFSIIDYKTSKTLTLRQDDIESGRLLQLVLYTMAVSDHLFAGQDVVPWKTGYWVIQKDGFKIGKLPQPGTVVEGQVVMDEDWSALVQSVRVRVGQIVRDVRAARFPMFNTDHDCGGRCEYRTVCRVGVARSLGKSPEQQDV